MSQVIDKAKLLYKAEMREIEEVEQDFEAKRKHRYPALKIVEGILRLFGYLSLAASVFAVLMLTIEQSKFFEVFSIPIVIAGFLGSLITIGFAEVIQVFIDIERNTRIAYQMDHAYRSHSIEVPIHEQLS